MHDLVAIELLPELFGGASCDKKLFEGLPLQLSEIIGGRFRIPL